MKEIFKRNVPGTTEILQKATVAVAGCGGLGSNAAVALVRSGVGSLILVDFDTIELSNLNRQYYFRKHVGMKKVEALAQLLCDINPDVNLDLHNTVLEPQMIEELFKSADLLIEAFDRAENKQWLIESWCKAFPNRPVIAASGLSGVGRTEAVKIHKGGNIYLCGDEKSQAEEGLCAARVAIVANMQANIAIAILTGKEEV